MNKAEFCAQLDRELFKVKSRKQGFDEATDRYASGRKVSDISLAKSIKNDLKALLENFYVDRNLLIHRKALCDNINHKAEWGEDKTAKQRELNDLDMLEIVPQIIGKEFYFKRVKLDD